jgi:hypothetical protein
VGRAGIVSLVRVSIDHDHGQDPGHCQLLALFALWRGLESRSSNDGDRSTVEPMTDQRKTGEGRHAETVRELYELIAALDRRVPQVQRVGEVSIARAAAALRVEALKRIQELESDEADVTIPVDAR